MSATKIRTGWIKLFTQMRAPQGALQRMFTIKPGNVYAGGKVTIDIERYGEDVAVAIKEFTGPNLNDFDLYTTKEFKPPKYNEGFPLDVASLINRMAGEDQFSDAYKGYAGAFVTKLAKGFKLMDHKIQRAVELQAAQILQTGKLSLKDEDGNIAYELDYKPKPEHFPTAAIPWSNDDADIRGDLLAMCNRIRANGQIQPKRLIMGDASLEAFLNNTVIDRHLDNRHVETSVIAPDMEDSGLVYYGYVWIGTYLLEIWTYDATYNDPETDEVRKYLDVDSCIVMGKDVRLDMTSALVPLPLGPDPRVAALMPGRMSSVSAGFDVTPNLYPTTNGKQIMGELETRPLLVPVQIDGFGCIKTGVGADAVVLE